MSISGINNTYSPGIRPSQSPAQRVDTGATNTTNTSAAATLAQPTQQKPGIASTATANALPVQAPKGTDPDLWSVLTQDERQFFARAGAMGPLTYGRIMTGNHAPPPPIARGGRLDVKV